MCFKIFHVHSGRHLPPDRLAKQRQDHDQDTPEIAFHFSLATWKYGPRSCFLREVRQAIRKPQDT